MFQGLSKHVTHINKDTAAIQEMIGWVLAQERETNPHPDVPIAIKALRNHERAQLVLAQFCVNHPEA